MNFKSTNTKDVLNHKENVGRYLNTFTSELFRRGVVHDYSKLSDEEAPIFEEATEKLKDLTYGSPEYKTQLGKMKPALDNHYRENSHHPEHYTNGIEGMSLLDLVEMIADWYAASERHKDGDVHKSLRINKNRFDIDDQLYKILENTLKEIDNLK